MVYETNTYWNEVLKLIDKIHYYVDKTLLTPMVVYSKEKVAL